MQEGFVEKVRLWMKVIQSSEHSAHQVSPVIRENHPDHSPMTHTNAPVLSRFSSGALVQGNPEKVGNNYSLST